MVSEAVLILARWAHFTTEMLLFGASLFPLYAFGHAADRARGRLPQPILLVAAVLSLFSLAIWIGCLIGQFADDTSLSGLQDTAEGLLFETSFGRVLLLRLGLSGVALRGGL